MRTGRRFPWARLRRQARAEPAEFVQLPKELGKDRRPPRRSLMYASWIAALDHRTDRAAGLLLCVAGSNWRQLGKVPIRHGQARLAGAQDRLGRAGLFRHVGTENAAERTRVRGIFLHFA